MFPRPRLVERIRSKALKLSNRNNDATACRRAVFRLVFLACPACPVFHPGDCHQAVSPVFRSVEAAFRSVEVAFRWGDCHQAVSPVFRSVEVAFRSVEAAFRSVEAAFRSGDCHQAVSPVFRSVEVAFRSVEAVFRLVEVAFRSVEAGHQAVSPVFRLVETAFRWGACYPGVCPREVSQVCRCQIFLVFQVFVRVCLGLQWKVATPSRPRPRRRT